MILDNIDARGFRISSRCWTSKKFAYCLWLKPTVKKFY